MEITDIAYIVGITAIVLTLYKMLFNPGAAASAALRKKMISLNPIKGKTYSEITSVAGAPTITNIQPGGKMCSWNSQKYAINLGFNKDNICTGVYGEQIIK